jgi:uncharacterized Fe-S cluster-containing MiaB family protein
LITFGIRVDDDGVVWERKNGSEEYQIKKDEAKYSVQKCSIHIACMYCSYYNVTSGAKLAPFNSGGVCQNCPAKTDDALLQIFISGHYFSQKCLKKNFPDIKKRVETRTSLRAVPG